MFDLCHFSVSGHLIEMRWYITRKKLIANSKMTSRNLGSNCVFYHHAKCPSKHHFNLISEMTFPCRTDETLHYRFFTKLPSTFSSIILTVILCRILISLLVIWKSLTVSLTIRKPYPHIHTKYFRWVSIKPL